MTPELIEEYFAVALALRRHPDVRGMKLFLRSLTRESSFAICEGFVDSLKAQDQEAVAHVLNGMLLSGNKGLVEWASFFASEVPTEHLVDALETVLKDPMATTPGAAEWAVKALTRLRELGVSPAATALQRSYVRNPFWQEHRSRERRGAASEATVQKMLIIQAAHRHASKAATFLPEGHRLRVRAPSKTSIRSLPRDLEALQEEIESTRQHLRALLKADTAKTLPGAFRRHVNQALLSLEQLRHPRKTGTTTTTRPKMRKR
jgi:hypothetical protein